MAVTQYGYHETLIDGYIDSLSAGISNSATTIPVNDAGDLPTQGEFRLQIGDEIIVCDGRSGLNVNAIERGAEGTTAASHSTSDEVRAVATDAGLNRLLLQHRGVVFSSREDANANPVNRFIDSHNNVLTVSDFTWFNMSSSEASALDVNGGIRLTIQDEAEHNLRGLTVPIPPAPYRIVCRLNMGVGMGTMDNTGTHAGLVLREKSTGKLTTASCRYGGRLAFWNWTNPTTFGTIIDQVQSFHENVIWLRIDDDGTNLHMRASNEGIGWSQTADSLWWEQGRKDHMTNAADQVGIYISSGSNSGSTGAGPAVAHATFEMFRIEERPIS